MTTFLKGDKHLNNNYLGINGVSTHIDTLTFI